MNNVIVSAADLIEKPMDLRPHVVLLGAGASRASFPRGDANGHRLPLMDDLVDTLALETVFAQADLNATGNFELLYSGLKQARPDSQLVSEIERRILNYFSDLSLPPTATIYDRLVLGLRADDAIFTFNWDPFLFDAYQRNRDVAHLPGIFFLHGNVRIGACPAHGQWGPSKTNCGVCGDRYRDVPLLYPISKKDYGKDVYC